MDPITTAIISAVAAGAASSAKEVGKRALVDAYEGLKTLLRRKYGEEAKVVDAVSQLEEEPESKGRQMVLAEQVEKSGAPEDPEVRQAAEQLQEKVEQQPGGSQIIHQVATGNYIAQAAGDSTATVNVNQPRDDED